MLAHISSTPIEDKLPLDKTTGEWQMLENPTFRDGDRTDLALAPHVLSKEVPVEFNIQVALSL